MPFNFSENKQNIDEKKASSLYSEVDKLKKLLEIKEKELRSSPETSSLKKEISAVREKLKKENVEYEKAKEKTEDGKEKQKNTEADNVILKRTGTLTPQQIKAINAQINDANVSRQLSILVNTALTKNIYQAIKMARNIGSAYLLDRFHDIIVNDLYEDFVKKKKIKSIK